MDTFSHLLGGFQIALTPLNILFCFIGAFIGTFVGVLPGIGPTGAMAMLLPVTMGVPPVSAVILLAGIYYGAQYGSSTTSILVNIPGEPTSIVTCIDGHQMAKQGRAGPALGISALGSFIAGTIAIMFLGSLAGPVTQFALQFGPPEYFGLMVLGMMLIIYLGGKSMMKSLVSATMGLIFTMVGMDIFSGKVRFGFGWIEMSNGIGLVPMAMGLFGLADIFLNLETKVDQNIFVLKLKGIFPNWQDLKQSVAPIFRGSFLGFFLGILPGGGPTLASIASYGIEKKMTKHPERFGHGAIEGVAGPESANNGAAGGSFVPLFTLGIPPNSPMAMLLGALMLYGMQPGPMLIVDHPEIFWGTIASMYLGNVMLLILNFPLIGLWVQILKIPYRILFPLIILFTLVGSYTVRNNVVDLLFLVIFGLLGYLMKKFDYEVVPMMLAFILGDYMETALRQSMIVSAGSLSIFFTRPIAAGCLGLAFLLLISPLIPWLRREKVLREEAAGYED